MTHSVDEWVLLAAFLLTQFIAFFILRMHRRSIRGWRRANDRATAYWELCTRAMESNQRIRRAAAGSLKCWQDGIRPPVEAMELLANEAMDSDILDRLKEITGGQEAHKAPQDSGQAQAVSAPPPVQES